MSEIPNDLADLIPIAFALETLVESIDRLRDGDPPLVAAGVTGLPAHVLVARDELRTAADMVDMEIAREVRRLRRTGVDAVAIAEAIRGADDGRL